MDGAFLALGTVATLAIVHTARRRGSRRTEELPPLPYPTDALEPQISQKTLRLHHDVHERSYVDGTRKALDTARNTGTNLATAREFAFNAAGVELHELYWRSLLPSGHRHNTVPARFSAQIRKDFGSQKKLELQILSLGTRVPGSGWVVLVWHPRWKRLLLLAIDRHENGWIPGAVPLLAIDLWEHAYYLDSPGDRPAYLRKVVQILDWAGAASRWPGG